MTRLRRSDPSSRGYTRRRSGKGFSYRDPDGARVTNGSLRERFDALAIPPAWNDVWISPYQNGHIQATGTDAAGRRQYIYHPAWREQKDRIKFDRALDLAGSLPSARGAVTRVLRESGTGRNRTLAAAFRMLDTACLRIGNERYADANGSHGLATLLCEHVQLDGDVVTLCFPGKSGLEWESEIVDADLARFMRERIALGAAERLLAWEEDGRWHNLPAAEINVFVRERTGDEFSAKDFRTLHGTVVAASSLAQYGLAASRRARDRTIVQAMRDAAEKLGNTPAIARKSYVDPRVVDHYIAGEIIDRTRLASAESELRSLLLPSP